eukprot:863310-Amphidinium_carterae.1
MRPSKCLTEEEKVIERIGAGGTYTQTRIPCTGLRQGDGQVLLCWPAIKHLDDLAQHMVAPAPGK